MSVEVAAAPGYGRPALRSLLAETDRAGLAVVSGLAAPLAMASLTRAGWLEQRESGLSASTGSFAFREVAVARGGSLRAVVTVDGLPAAAATCWLLREVPGPRKRGEEPWVTVKQGTAGPDGVWRVEGISAASYTVKVSPAGSGTSAVTAVNVDEGQEAAIEMHLRSSSIEGTVTRGKRPAAGYRLRGATVVSSSAAEVATVFLKRAALVVPREVVATHLARLGLSGATDGSGRLAIPALAPGDYDLYLGSGSNPMTMVAGLPHGHLGAASLAPLTTTELEVTVSRPGE